ncbi:MAG: LapA family protein [Burkholderiaceae bacterium]|nr:LapA family protein [Burkholderiaceae bacterium]
MQKISTYLAWVATAIIAALVVLNWNVMMANAQIDLLFLQISAPLGVVMLAAAGGLFAIFFVLYLRNQISSLMETRRLLKEVQRAHDLADKAEASRIENLHKLISTEFRLLNERLSLSERVSTAAVAAESGKPDDGEFRPVSLTEIVSRN